MKANVFLRKFCFDEKVSGVLRRVWKALFVFLLDLCEKFSFILKVIKTDELYGNINIIIFFFGKILLN